MVDESNLEERKCSEIKVNESSADHSILEEEHDNLRSSFEDVSRELCHMQKLHDLSLEEWQLAQQVSSTDIQRIMQFISEEQHLEIEG